MVPEAHVVQHFKKTFTVLVEDCKLAERSVLEADSPFHRRVFVRAFSSYIEGLAYQLKCVVRDALESLTPDEVRRIKVICGFADCEVIWLKKKGSHDGLSALERFCMALGCYAKLYTEPFELGCKSKLDTFIKLRNRVTHPKSITDLEVQDPDLKEAFSTAQLVIDEITVLFSATNAKNLTSSLGLLRSA